MAHRTVKRILVYTHNSIGLGHAFRTAAVITGIKKWRPDIDFLVISGTSVPQVFFKEGIELIKLPSIKLDIDREDSAMYARYLSGFELEEIFDFRQRLIGASFDFFQPDVLIIEHNMTGQMSELIPLLMKKWVRQGGPMDFTLVHICRGIMKWVPLLQIPYQNPRHRSESINIGSLYDFMYVLENREVIDINKEFLGDDPELEEKIQYLGKITNKVYEELPTRKEALDRFGLPDKKIILLSLGRNHHAVNIGTKLLDFCGKSDVAHEYQVVLVLDPYLEDVSVQILKKHPFAGEVRFLPFFPDLIDLVYHSDLIVCRAGYNTVNEILLTGVKAVIIPESHGGGEQELRASSVRGQNIVVLSENEVLDERSHSLIRDLLKRPVHPGTHRFNKYDIGKKIIEDLENWESSRKRCGES